MLSFAGNPPERVKGLEHRIIIVLRNMRSADSNTEVQEMNDKMESTILKMRAKFQGRRHSTQKRIGKYDMGVVSRRDGNAIKVKDKLNPARVQRVSNPENKGLFSPRLRAYRCFGSPELDSLHLTLKDFMDKRKNQFENELETDVEKINDNQCIDSKANNYEANVIKVLPKTTQCSESENYKAKDSLKEYMKNKKLKRAGMDSILELLNESKKRMNAVRAGQPYANVARTIEHVKRECVVPSTKDMVILPITKSDELNADKYFVKKHQTENPRPALIEPIKERSRTRCIKLNDATKVLKFTGKVKQKMLHSRLRNLQLRNEFAKYEDIYTILCGILNIRSRDLKKRSPLQKDVLKNYLKCPNYERIAQINFDPLSRNRKMIGHDSDSGEDVDESSECPSKIPRGTNASNLFVSSARLFTSGRQKATKCIRSLTRKQMLDTGRPMTWEDLLTVEFKNMVQQKQHYVPPRNRRVNALIHPHGDHLPRLSDQVRHTAPHHHTQFIKRLGKNRIGEFSHTPTSKMSPHDEQVPDRVMVCERRPAPWQLVNGKVNETTIEKQGGDDQTKARNITTKWNKELGRKQCKRIQTRAIETTTVALKEFQRKNAMLLLARHKISTFDQTSVMKGNFQTLKNKMEDAKSYLKWFTSETDVLPVAGWYQELNYEWEQLKKNFENNVHYQVMEELETKMKKFAYADSKTLPRGKEKLCLLVYSMPAELFFKQQMQYAVRFVQEKVLHADGKCIDNWLNDRKIPCQYNDRT